MKMRITIFLTVFFYSSSLISQAIYPIQFENYNSKWTAIAGELSDTMTIFFTRKPLIYGDDIFLVSDIWVNYYNGYQVDKISRVTGEKLWSTSFKTNLNDRERVKNYYINSDNEFELLTMKEYDNDYFLWQKASFMKRTFDVQNGNELSSFFMDYSKIPMLLNSGASRNGIKLNRNNHIVVKGDNYQYVDMFNTEKSYFRTIEFNLEEEIIKDTMFVFEYYGWAKRVTSQIVGNKIFYFWDTYKEDSISVRRLFFKRLDENLNYDVELDLKGKMDQADGYRLSFANDSFFIISAYHGLPFNGRIDYKDYSIYLFDMNGNVLDKIYVEKSDDVDRFKPGVATVLNSDNKLLVVSTYRDLNGIGHLDFLRSSLSNDSTVVLKTLKMVNNDFVDVDLVSQMADGDILVGFGHYIFVKNTEDNSKSYNTHRAEWQLFDVEDLLSSISEINDTQNRICAFIITPNPTADLIKITPNTKIQPKSIQIFNTIGQKIKSLPYQPTLDLSHFEKGIYFIQLHGGNGVDLGVQRVVVN